MVLFIHTIPHCHSSPSTTFLIRTIFIFFLSPSSIHSTSPFMMTVSFLLFFLLFLLLCSSLLVSSQKDGLTFFLQTFNAPWSARSVMQTESMNKPITITTTAGQTLNIPTGSLILQGGGITASDGQFIPALHSTDIRCVDVTD